eukprot:g9626.t1
MGPHFASVVNGKDLCKASWAAAAAHQQNPYANANEYPGYGGGAVSGGQYGYVGGASTPEEELQLQQAAAYHSALSPDATAFNPYSGAALTPQTQTQTSALTQLHGQPQHLSRMLGGVDQAQLRGLPAQAGPSSSPAADAELLAACLHYQQQAASARRQYQQLQAEHASFLHSVYGSSGGGTAGGGYGYGGREGRIFCTEWESDAARRHFYEQDPNIVCGGHRYWHSSTGSTSVRVRHCDQHNCCDPRSTDRRWD